MRLLCGKDCLKAKHIRTKNKINQKAELHRGTEVQNKKAEVHRGTEVPRGSERYPEVPSGTQR